MTTESTKYSTKIMTDLSAVIAASGSLSVKVDISGTTLCGFIMPAAWTAADITLQGSLDGNNFFDITAVNGVDITFTVAADKCVVFAPTLLAGLRWFKVRSGTSASPTAQAAERTIVFLARSV